MASPKKKWLRMKALEEAANIAETEEQEIEIEHLTEQNNVLETIVIKEEAKLASTKIKTKANKNNRNNKTSRKKKR